MSLSKSKKSLLNSAVLILVAIIWGMAFVVQSSAMDYIKPFTFNGIRMLLGGLSVLPVCLITGRKNKNAAPVSAAEKKQARKTLFAGGIACGVCLFTASSLQQIGLVETSPGKAGFITALYIVLVPLMGLFTKKRIGWKVWLGVGLAVAGLYLLCVTESLSIQRSDFLVLLCAFFYACHIVVIGYFAPKTDAVKMSCIQFFVSGMLGVIAAMIKEGMPDMQVLSLARNAILYTGIMSTGVAFTLQIVAQKNVNETVASLLMSMESLFAAIFSWLVLNQKLSQRELIGAALMAVALVLAQLPEKFRTKPAATSEAAAQSAKPRCNS